MISLNCATSRRSSSAVRSVSCSRRAAAWPRRARARTCSPSTPSTILPNSWTSGGRQSEAKRGLPVAGQSPATVSSFKPRLSTVSIMPGIENFAPERTETSSGLAASPKLLPSLRSMPCTPATTCSHSPSGNWPVAGDEGATGPVVIVKPGGHGHAARVISATPAPLPPSRSRLALRPARTRYPFGHRRLPYLQTACRRLCPRSLFEIDAEIRELAIRRFCAVAHESTVTS